MRSLPRRLASDGADLRARVKWCRRAGAAVVLLGGGRGGTPSIQRRVRPRAATSAQTTSGDDLPTPGDALRPAAADRFRRSGAASRRARRVDTSGAPSRCLGASSRPGRPLRRRRREVVERRGRRSRRLGTTGPYVASSREKPASARRERTFHLVASARSHGWRDSAPSGLHSLERAPHHRHRDLPLCHISILHRAGGRSRADSAPGVVQAAGSRAWLDSSTLSGLANSSPGRSRTQQAELGAVRRAQASATGQLMVWGGG